MTERRSSFFASSTDGSWTTQKGDLEHVSNYIKEKEYVL